MLKVVSHTKLFFSGDKFLTILLPQQTARMKKVVVITIPIIYLFVTKL